MVRLASLVVDAMAMFVSLLEVDSMLPLILVK